MSRIILGLDIGTTSISGVALDDSGRLLHSVTCQHHAAVSGLPEGYAEQDPDTLLTTAHEVLRQLAAATVPADIKAIGLTGQMHSTVLLDGYQAPIGNVITWQDKRVMSVVDPRGSATLLDELLERAPAEAIRNSGCRLAPGYLGSTVFALRRLRQWPEHCASVSFVADWVGSQLTGEPVVTDRSHAASSGLADLAVDRWNSDLLQAADVNPDWLPKVQPSGRPVGRLTEAMSERTGIPAGTLVGNALGDNQAAVLSSLPDDPNAVLINIGTGGQIVWRVPEFVRVDGMDTRYLPGSSSRDDDFQFILVGAGLVGGNSIAWVNSTVRSWLNAFGVDRSEAEIWSVLQQQMQGEPDSNGLICEPYFSGTRPQPLRRGVFRQVGSKNFTPASVAGSILQGIAQVMHDVYVAASAHRPTPVSRIVMSGNAPRQIPWLVKFVSQRFGVPVDVSPFTEEAATGAAMLTGVRLGVWKNLADAKGERSSGQ
ncbi:MAG: FGGY family carbohydrate kinase [Planctomycetaceae bacterium]